MGLYQFFTKISSKNVGPMGHPQDTWGPDLRTRKCTKEPDCTDEGQVETVGTVGGGRASAYLQAKVHIL